MKDEVVLRVVAGLLMPFLLLFGAYVTFHGEGGPGGGFQGGVIIASGFILHGLVHGMPRLRKVISRRVTLGLTALGVMIFVGVGLVGMFFGEAFLDHGGLTPADPIAGQAWGMTIAEIGVGIAVAAVMVTIFDALFEEA